MDTLYSFSLLTAIILSVTGVVLSAVLAFSPPMRDRTIARIRTAVLVCGSTALVTGTGSAAVHLVSGHGLESVAPMQFIQFIALHKAYWIVLVLCVVSLFGYFSYYRRKRSEDDTAS